MDKFKKYNELLCKEFCEEMKKFEEHPTHERLKKVKDLGEAWADLQCVEAGYAMRKIAERKCGHDTDMTEWDEEDIYDIYDAVTNRRGGARRRGENGRFVSNHGGRDGMGYPYMPPIYNDYDGDMRHRGRERDMDKGMYDGYDPNQMYTMRQQDGRPIMTPYNTHEKGMAPKKLTKEQYEDWVEDMVNADGTSGAHWTIEQTKQVQKKKGYEEVDAWAFWAAMNASYSDMCGFFKNHNMDNADAYADYTMDFWFEDEDAVGGGKDGNVEKLAAYYAYVVEK